MPRGKSDRLKTASELDAEIKALQEQVSAKRKAMQAAKAREKREVMEARAVEAMQRDARILSKAQELYAHDLQDDGRSVYEQIAEMVMKA